MNKKRVVIPIVVSILLISMSVLGYILFSKYRNSLDLCKPYNLKYERKEEVTTISWSTLGKCSSFVKYGEDINTLNYTNVEDDGFASTKNHNVSLEYKKENRLYMVIISDNKQYGYEGLPILVK